MKFSKVIIWGHKLHSHSHSYIHYGFFRAFKSLGYDVLWLDNSDNIDNINFDNSLFLTECQVEEKIPLSRTSKYISHVIGMKYISSSGEIKYSTGEPLKYYHSYEPNLILDTFGQCTIKNAEKLNEYTYIQNKTLIQPWATDLLPEEFDFELAKLPRKQEAYFFGTVVESGWNKNKTEIDDFDLACKAQDIIFDYRGLYTKGPIANEEAIQKMRQARIAPIIQSPDQIDAWYLPCRFFKNVSYGHYAVTNSPIIPKIFDSFMCDIIFTTPGLMVKSIIELEKKDKDKEILLSQMRYIQDQHTYVSRIKTIMELL